MGMYIPQPTLANIRWVDWGKSYLWDILFAHKDTFVWDNSALWDFRNSTSPPPPPEHFQGWFPAYSVNEPVYSVQSNTVPTPMVNFPHPKTLNTANLTVSFYDDASSNLRIWLNTWALYMFGVDSGSYSYTQSTNNYLTPTVQSKKYECGARPLSQCLSAVFIRKYSSDHRRTLIRKYLVYPTENLANDMSSETRPDTFTATFAVVSGMYTRPEH